MCKMKEKKEAQISLDVQNIYLEMFCDRPFPMVNVIWETAHFLYFLLDLLLACATSFDV